MMPTHLVISFYTLTETKAGGIGAHNLRTCRLRWLPKTLSGQTAFFNL
jgi:hypothetical protein